MQIYANLYVNLPTFWPENNFAWEYEGMYLKWSDK